MDDWSDLLKLLNSLSIMECPHCEWTCFWGSEELQAHVIGSHRLVNVVEEVVVVTGDGDEGEEEGEGEEEEVGVVINEDEDEGEEEEEGEEENEVEMDAVDNDEKEVVVVEEEDATDYSRIKCLFCGRFY